MDSIFEYNDGMDFIKKILDDAYADGLHYDVYDMANDIIEFAIIRTTCNHIEMKLCFKKLSYLPSLNESVSIVSIYPSLLLD